MALEVLNVASTSNSNTDCPTNPKLKTNLGATSNRHFTVIHPDSSEDITYSEILGTMPGSSDLFTEWENLENTEGFRIKCYDSNSDSGIQLDTIDLDYYNFVLIYSDNANMHHFAKITETTSQDADGDAFDFEPRLGYEIPKGTKFMLFKTSATIASTNALAFSAGIKDDLRNELVCARPLFYFVNSSLDKANQLNHNVKYFAQNNTASSGSSVVVNNLKVTFLTHQDFGKRIIDYSPYSLEIDLVDKMRDNDVATIPVLQESSLSLGGDYTDYNDVFYNARRQTSDDISGSLDLTGPTRYLHYDFSPDQCNHIPTVIDLVVDDSIGGRSGIANAKMIDNARILPKKISEDDPLRIRHYVHNGAVMDWFELKAELNTHSGSRAYTLLTDYADITDILSVGDEVRINNRICFVNAISSSSITLEEFSRLETESILTNTATLTDLEGYTIYRRVFSAQNNTLLTTFSMLDSVDAGVREYDLYVKFLGTSYKFIYASVSLCNADNQTLTLSFDLDAYSSTPLEYIDGGYQIFIERFNGIVEDKETFKENGQTFMKIEGRDNLRKLLSPIVNKNYLFSEDIIYTTQSFNNKIVPVTDSGGTQITAAVSANSLSITPSATISNLSAGDLIFAGIALNDTLSFLGRYSSTNTLEDYPKIWGSTLYLHKASEKNFVFNKALSANHNLSIPLSSLSGSSEKGIVFNGGTKLASDGSDSESLRGTGNTDENLGYPLLHPSSIGIDLPFQAKLESTTNFDTVNTLLDFTILGAKTQDDGTILEIAPYLPITLGRVDLNFGNTERLTLQNAETFTSQQSNVSILQLSSTTRTYFRGEPVFLNNEFLGYCLEHSGFVSSGIYKCNMLLDREVSVEINDILQYCDLTNSSQYSLNFINGAHLHSNKTIGMLYSTTSYNDYYFFNHDYASPYSSSYGLVHGLPVYRTTNIEKGNFNYRDVSKPVIQYNSEEDSLSYYGQKLSKIKYYADAYRIETANSETYYTTLYSSPTAPFPIERVGFEPASGSRFFDALYRESGFEFDCAINASDLLAFDTGRPFEVKSRLEQKDPKVARMFLYTNCDIEPYSGNRKDSLLSRNRDLTKYSVMLLKETNDKGFSVENSISTTSTTSISNIDSDYELSSIISASKQTDQIHQFGIMRLTECVYDWHFNQIDPENIPEKRVKIPEMNYRRFHIIDSGLTATISDSTTITMSASADTILIANDTLYDENGRQIGSVSSVSGTSVVLTTKPAKTKVSVSPPAHNTGTKIYIERAVFNPTMKGRDSKDSFTPKGDIDMLKGMIKNNYWGNTGGWYETKYGSQLHDYVPLDPEIIYPIDLGQAAFITESVSWVSGSSYELVLSNNKHIQVGDKVYPSNSLGNHLSSPGSTYFGSSYFSSSAEVTAVSSDGVTITIDDSTNSSAGSGYATFVRVGGFATHDSSRIIKTFATIDNDSASTIKGRNMNQYGMIGVVLDTFSVEDDSELEIGLASSVSNNFQIIYDKDDVLDGIYERSFNIPSISTVQKFNEFISINRDSADAIVSAEGKGAELGFKFRLNVKSSVISAKTTGSGAGGKSVYNYSIATTDVDDQYWLNFVNNLGGCYLVSEAGSRYSTSSFTPTDSKPITANETNPDTVAYVLHHAIKHDQTTLTHLITTDIALTAGWYRIMQPNHTCFYEYSPTTIELNMLSSKYTKMAKENKMYDVKASWNVSAKGTGFVYEDGENATSSGEAILSMYVPIDINARLNQTYDSSSDKGAVVSRKTQDYLTATYFMPTNKIQMAISDGENFYKTSVQLISASVVPRLYFGEMKEMLGAVSITEPFTITVPKNVDTSAKRLMIGAGLTVGAESGDIINSLLESNGIEFDKTTPPNKLYLSPNIQGLSLYDAINSVTNKIGYTLVKEKGIFVIRPGDDANNYTNITLSDYGDYQIYDFKKSSTIFDEYNEIVVYGATTKSTRKNIKSIQKKGRKTLEVFERDLFSQEDTDRRASELFLMHNKLNEKLTIEVGHTGISQIKPGDIISVEIRRENIPRSHYLVLSIRHLLTGNMVLELGRYSKQLEDRFAELIISNQRTNAALREQKFNENTIDFTLLETLKVKPLRLLIRKTESSGSVFGFSTTFSPSTIFNSVTGSETVLVEEDF